MARAIWMTLSVCVGLALSGCGAADDTDFASGEDRDGNGINDGNDISDGNGINDGNDVGDVSDASSVSGVEGSPAPEFGSLAQPLTRGSVSRAGYTCAGLKCSCTGDVDCNDMFSDGVCGDVSSCDTTDPLNPTCECLILRVQKPPRQVLVVNPPLLLLAR